MSRLGRRLAVWLNSLMADDEVTASATISFGFIRDDIRRQFDASRDILDEAEKIEGVISAGTLDPGTKAILEKTIRRLIETAQRMTANASTTATTTSSTVSTITETVSPRRK